MGLRHNTRKKTWCPMGWARKTRKKTWCPMAWAPETRKKTWCPMAWAPEICKNTWCPVGWRHKSRKKTWCPMGWAPKTRKKTWCLMGCAPKTWCPMGLGKAQRASEGPSWSPEALKTKSGDQFHPKNTIPNLALDLGSCFLDEIDHRICFSEPRATKGPSEAPLRFLNLMCLCFGHLRAQGHIGPRDPGPNQTP